MKQIVIKNPHNFVIQFILLQIPFRANLRFLFPCCSSWYTSALILMMSIVIPSLISSDSCLIW